MTKEEAIKILNSKRNKEKYTEKEWIALIRQAVIDCGDYLTPDEREKYIIILKICEVVMEEENE